MNRRLLAFLLVLMLAVPAAAFAASSVTIEGTEYLAEGAPEEGYSGKGRNNDPDGPDTWRWDGKEDLTLDGYDGGQITVLGDLTMTIEGETTVSGDRVSSSGDWTESDYALFFGSSQQYSDDPEVAEVTIIGAEDSSLHVTRSIESRYSELTFKDANMQVEGSIWGNTDPISFDGSTLIQRDGDLISRGELNIVNGSNIDFEADHGWINVMIGYDDGANPHAHLNIADSRVRAVTYRDDEYGTPAICVGYDPNSVDSDNRLTITNSYVEASSTNDTAILSANFYYEQEDWQSRPQGKIEIINSEVITPEGGRVVNVVSDDNNNILSFSYVKLNGQAIGMADVTDYAAALADGTLPASILIDRPQPDPEPQPEPEPTPEPTPGPTPMPTPGPSPAPAPAPALAPATVLPKTADATLILEGAVAASGTLLALAGFLRRRRG